MSYILDQISSTTLGVIFVITFVITIIVLFNAIKSVSLKGKKSEASCSMLTTYEPENLSDGEIEQCLKHYTIIYRSKNGLWSSYIKIGEHIAAVEIESDRSLKKVAMATFLHIEVDPILNGPKS